jgi:hypothetical protein
MIDADARQQPTSMLLPSKEEHRKNVRRHVTALAQAGFPPELLNDPMVMLGGNVMYQFTAQHPTVQTLDDVLKPKLLVPMQYRRRYPSTEHLINEILAAGAHPRHYQKIESADNCICLQFQMQQRFEDQERILREMQEMAEQAALDNLPLRAGQIDPSSVKLLNEEQRNTHLADHLAVNVLLYAHRNDDSENAAAATGTKSDAWSSMSVRPEFHCGHLMHFSSIEYNVLATRAIMRVEGRFVPRETPWQWSLICYFYSYF